MVLFTLMTDTHHKTQITHNVFLYSYHNIYDRYSSNLNDPTKLPTELQRTVTCIRQDSCWV